MKPGNCINVPANVKHWHGAAPDSWFQHLAVEVPGEDTSNEWCELVDVITQLGFYAGWPKAWAAFRLLKEILVEAE